MLSVGAYSTLDADANSMPRTTHERPLEKQSPGAALTIRMDQRRVMSHTYSTFFALWLRGVSVVLIATAIAIPGCASKSLETQTGLASFYGSAEDSELFAAHPSYPLGTLARVTNLENDRKVEVRITDRGPKPRKQAEGRIIDLSWAAARELDFTKEGIVRVRVEVLKWGSDRPR
jgi:rare lipoprotein A